MPVPIFVTMRDIWDALEREREQTVGEFLDGLEFRHGCQCASRNGPKLDAVYNLATLHRCGECGVTELDAMITSGLCEECLQDAEIAAENLNPTGE